MNKQNTESTAGFWGFFTENLRLTYLLIITIVIAGTFSIIQMPKESAPEIDVPVAVVVTSLPGASAEDVETLVTDPLEDAIEGVADIEELTSTSQKGLSQITIQFTVGSDSGDAVSEVRNQVAGVVGELPDDAGDPSVQKISFADQPITTLAVSGPYELVELGEYAETIAGEIEGITNVSDANVSGDPEREFAVRFSQSSLAQYGLSVGELANSLREANTDIPIGSIDSAGSVYTVRFAGRLETAADIREVPVKTSGGGVVQLGDIATVEETFKDLAVENRFSTEGGEARPAVSINVFKEGGEGSIISIVNEVDEVIAGLSGAGIPDDITIEKIRDDGELISRDLSNLLSSGAATMVIIVLVLVLFLGWREAILASLSVPLTFLAGLTFLYLLGGTINFLSLFSLILVLGILVDAAIVITEGFSGALEREDSPKAAAFATLREFQTPLVTGTLTTVFVFAPMLLAGGIIGEFISTIPITVSAVLLCALFVALGLLTALGSRFFTPRETTGGASRRVRAGIDRAYRRYSTFLEKILLNTKRRTMIFVAMTVLFFAALALPVSGLLTTTLFPASDMDIVTVNLELPAGTPLTETNREITAIADELRADPRVESLLVSAGSGASEGSITVGSGDPNVAGIVVSLAEGRGQSSTELVAEFNDSLSELTAGTLTVSQQSGGPPTGQPVQVNLSGGTLTDLQTASEQVAGILESISGTQNVQTGLDTGGSEFVATVDRAAAERFGVTPQTVATLLRTRVSGLEATNIKTDGDDIDVTLRFENEAAAGRLGTAETIGAAELLGTTVQTAQGMTPLSNLVEFTLASSVPAISHDGGERQITVGADVGPETTAPAVLSELQDRLSEITLAGGVTTSFGGESEDVTESFTDIFVSMIIGVILIFALLTFQFNSFKQPLYMIATIPLALIGVFFGLAVVGQPLSFPAFIGVVALAGIVVNNAIILIDRINTNRANGDSMDKAIYEGARSRLQPIILTTLTTIGGMIPLLFADPTWAPLAYAIIFGLLFATVLTLVVVPLLYQRFSKPGE